MFTKSRAIVLNTRKHKENALILQLYTEEYGRGSFILHGAYGKKNGKKSSFLQPLSIVAVDADARPNYPFSQIKDIRPEYTSHQILFDPHKNAIAFFLAEVLSRILLTNEKDKALFSFLQHSVQYLDLAEKGVANFHIAFLIRLSLFLGFFPTFDRRTNPDGNYYDLKQAAFSFGKPLHNHYLTPQETQTLTQISRINYTNMHQFRFSRQERSELLDKILSYYKLHISDLGNIHALSVLKEVFD